MATKNMAYDHPTYITRQACSMKLPASAGAVSAGKFLAFTAMKVKSINMMVDIAGTSSGSYTVKNGTTSITVMQTLDSAAGYMPAQYATDITLASGGYVDFVTATVGATVATSVMIEYEIIAGANVTA